jgi:hypothetical protein
VVEFVQDGSPVFKWQCMCQPFLSDVYQQIVPNVRYARAPLAGDALARFEHAQALLFDDPPFDFTDAYASYADLKTQVAAKTTQWIELESQLTTAADAEQEVLRGRISALEAGLEAQRGLLRALDEQHGFEEALRVWRSAQIIDMPPSFKDTLQDLGSHLFDLTSAFDTHVRGAFWPDRLAEENWVPVTITRADIAAAAADSPLVPPVESAAGLASLADDDIDRIDVEIQVLRIQRPWMWDALFTNRMWRWEVDDEPVSTGGAAPTGKVPGYTTAIVLARNLRISGRATLIDTGVVGTDRSVQLATFRLAVPERVAGSPALRIEASRRLALDGALLEGRPRRREPALARALPAAPVGPVAPLGRVGPVGPVGRLPVGELELDLPGRITRRPRRLLGGTVTGAAGEPVADATVQVTGAVTGRQMVKTTGPGGDVSFVVFDDEPLALQVSRDGFQPHAGEVQPGADFLVQLQPVAPPPGVALSVAVHKLDGDGAPQPMDVAVQVSARSLAGDAQQIATVGPGESATLSLPPGPYRVGASCDVYDAAGAGTVDVDLQADQRLEFGFRPRTILEGDQTYVVGFVCRRVPRCPDPHPDARW